MTRQDFQGDPGRDARATAILPRFAAALRNGELEAHFQPIIALATGQRHGFEVLARWRDPERGLLHPGSFSSVFTTPGLAAELTHAIVSQSFSRFQRRRDVMGARREYLGINLGTPDLVRLDFIDEMHGLIDAAGLSWNDIAFEITETTILGTRDGPVFRNLSEIRARGATVALDDFGTGFGGLLHLRNWPIDTIKIDRRFVTGLELSAKNRAIPHALITMARDLGLGVVAEGIETRASFEILRAMGCEYGQGYFFNRPAPIDVFYAD